MREHAVRWFLSVQETAELRIGEDQFLRHHAVGQDLLRAVDVVQEGVDRLHPLHQPFGQAGPFGCGEDARHDIEGDDPLCGFFLAIDGKGDAELAEGGLGLLLPAVQFGERRILDPGRQFGQARAATTVAATAPYFVERRPVGHLPPERARALKRYSAFYSALHKSVF